jgi:hypothetical protein
MVTRTLRIPNDVVLIIHRYIHRVHVSKINIHYRSNVYLDSYNVLMFRHEGETVFKCYNLRSLHVVNATNGLKWSVFNRKRVKVCDLPENY